MLLAYLDESYNALHYWIVALVCPQDDLVPLTEALDDVVGRAATTYRISPRAELHGHRLFHGADDWVALKPLARARIAVYNDAFAAIGTSGASILVRRMSRWP